MQFSETKSTMPFEYCTTRPAPGRTCGNLILATHAAVLADQPFEMTVGSSIRNTA
jgi:hypothetical protein